MLAIANYVPEFRKLLNRLPEDRGGGEAVSKSVDGLLDNCRRVSKIIGKQLVSRGHVQAVCKEVFGGVASAADVSWATARLSS